MFTEHKNSFKITRLVTEMCFVTLLVRDFLIQYYLHANTFLHGAFDDILKVDTC